MAVSGFQQAKMVTAKAVGVPYDRFLSTYRLKLETVLKRIGMVSGQMNGPDKNPE